MLLFFTACHREDPAEIAPVEEILPQAVLQSLSMERIRDDIELLASDEVAGRAPGSPGGRFVRDYLAAEMEAAGLSPVGGSFVLEAPLSLDRTRYALDEQGLVYAVPSEQIGANLFGLYPGADPELADEVVLLVAHYDHLGVTEQGDPYNGAFDDIAAVCALLELARALSSGAVALPRTVGFLFTDAEEDGLDGAAAWALAPSVSLADITAVLSIDPIGRPILTDFAPLVVIGPERSPEIGAALTDIVPSLRGEIRRVSRTPVVGFASDQDVFWGLSDPIPSLWVSSGGMSFYHTVDDDPITIDYRSLSLHIEAIALLAARLARAEARPEDIGPQPLSILDLEEAVALIDGALASSELTEEERATGEQYRATFEAAIQAGDPGRPDAAFAYAGVLLYVIEELTPDHPGPIPPPFPQ